jgi:hypothetical protein
MSVERKLYFETKDGEKFYEDHYNDIRIIVREKDGYINTTKMCTDNNKRFRDYIKFDEWKEIERFFQLSEGGGNSHRVPLYELRQGYPAKVTGSYIHPKLVHFVAHW